MKVKIIALCVAICLVAGLLAACGVYELHDGEEAPSGFSSIEISNEIQPKSLQSADSYLIRFSKGILKNCRGRSNEGHINTR